MKLSIVIPTYNERQRLPATYRSIVLYIKKKKLQAEIIFSDGSSTDGTKQYIESLVRQKKMPIKTIFDKKREGKGFGVKKGMLCASGDAILFMDADNSTKIEEIEKFIPLLKNYQVIIGSRYAGVEALVKQNFVRRTVSRGGSMIIRRVSGLEIKDTQCGFKLFKRRAAKEIFSRLYTKGWGFDVEVLLLAKNLGYKIKEVPVKWRDSQGSHLRAGKDSIKTLFEVIRILRLINKNEKK